MNKNHEIKDLNEILKSPNFIQDMIANLMTLTKTSNKFENNDEFSFYKKNPSLKEKLKNLNNRILQITESINTFAGRPQLKIQNKTLKYSEVVEVLDVYMENVDSKIDKIKALAQQVDNTHPSKELPKTIQLKDDFPKPQLVYSIDDFDNDVAVPFIPKLREKPNAKVPIDEEVKFAQNDKTNFMKTRDSNYVFPHPYQNELETFEYLPEQVEPNVAIQNPTKFEKDQYSLINTEQGLKVLRNLILHHLLKLLCFVYLLRT